MESPAGRVEKWVMMAEDGVEGDPEALIAKEGEEGYFLDVETIERVWGRHFVGKWEWFPYPGLEEDVM